MATTASEPRVYPTLDAGPIHLIDESGRVVLEPGYDAVADFLDGYARVRRAGKEGLIDAGGREILRPDYDAVSEVADPEVGIPIRIDGEWGYARPGGAILVEPRYAYAKAFSEGLAAVTLIADGRERLLYIDPSGAVVLRDAPDGPYPFRCGRKLAEVVRGHLFVSDGRYGFIDRSGRMAIPSIYGYCSHEFDPVSCAAYAKIGADHHFIDVEGRRVSDSFSWASPPEGGFATCQVATSTWRVLRVGDGPVATLECLSMSRVLFGFASFRAHDGRNGLVAATGEVVLDPLFQYIHWNDSGMATVRDDSDCYGAVDLATKAMIPCVFDDFFEFRGGLARVEVDGVRAYIDRRGRIVHRAKPGPR